MFGRVGCLPTLSGLNITRIDTPRTFLNERSSMNGTQRIITPCWKRVYGYLLLGLHPSRGISGEVVGASPCVRPDWQGESAPEQGARKVTPQWLSDGRLGNGGARKVTPLRLPPIDWRVLLFLFATNYLWLNNQQKRQNIRL